MTTANGKRTLMTYPTGIEYDPLAMGVEDIQIEDIAHALSHLCRFNGAVRDFYSVAQHSVLVSVEAEREGARRGAAGREFALWGLLHEVAEAYSGFGDVCGPTKRDASVAAVVKPIERAIDLVAASRFALPPDFASHPVVKTADRIVLAWEDRDLRGRASMQLAEMVERVPREKLVAEAPEAARASFLARWAEVSGRPRFA